MDESRRQHLRAVEAFNWLLSWTAPTLVAVLVMEAVLLRVTLGRWPVVYRDASAGAVSATLDAVAGVGLMILFYGLPAWCASIAVLCFAGKRRMAAKRGALYLAAVAVLLGDPFGLVTWWMD